MVHSVTATVPHSQNHALPRILITLGDPAGIGPEVVAKTLDALPQNPSLEITLVGNAQVWHQTLMTLGLSKDKVQSKLKRLIDIPAAPNQLAKLCLGCGNAASGDLSFRTLQTAIDRCLHEHYNAIVTAPIAKSAWLAAGHTYPGQTELLAEMAGVNRFGMMFVARSPQTQWTLRTLLATTHIPLSAVPTALTPEVMTLKLELLLDCLQQQFGIDQPRIAIAGLNPHSGELGQLGREEVDWLIPWLQEQRHRFPNAYLAGPIPPDTLWVQPGQAWYRTGKADYDGYLALYHDQGLIPVKLMAFDRAVNTTIGLPFVRTSPDHGTAFDIAGQGIAQADSMMAALDLAIELSPRRP